MTIQILSVALVADVRHAYAAPPTLDGFLDRSFGGGSGIAVFTDPTLTDSTGEALAIDGVGRIIVAGTATTATDLGFVLTRYSTSGALDTSFGTGGRVTVFGGGVRLSLKDLAVDSVGRIVVVGTAVGSTRNGVALARFTPGGALDPSFAGGLVVDVSAGTSSDANSLAIDASNRIVVTGSITTYGTTTNSLTRYTAAGALDTGFGSAGSVTTTVGGWTDIAVSSAGRLLVTGNGYNSNRSGVVVAAYTSNGGVDATFGSAGFISDFTTGSSSSASAIAIDTAGRIVVVGSAVLPTGRVFAVFRYSAAGTPDASFGNAGTALNAPASGINVGASSVAFDGSGRLVVGGGPADLMPIGVAGFAVARLMPDGSVDRSFGGLGDGYTVDLAHGMHVVDVAIDAADRPMLAGRAVSAGGAHDSLALARLASATAPGAPTSVEVSQSIDPYELLVEWDAPADGGTPITHYSAVASPGGASCTANGIDGYCFIDALTPGTAYSVIVTATNLVGTGPASSPSAGVVVLGIASSPRSITAVPGDHSVTVSWSPPADDGGSPIEGYVAGAFPAEEFCSTTTTTTCTITNLPLGAQTVALAAVTAVGVGDIATLPVDIVPVASPPVPLAPIAPRVSADKTAPLPVAGLVARGQLLNDGSMGVQLSWTLPGGADVDHVEVAVRQGTAGPATSRWRNFANLSRTDATLVHVSAGRNYVFSVFAVDAAGNISAPTTLNVPGSSAKVTVSRSKTAAGDLVSVRGALTNVGGKPLANMPVDVLIHTAGATTWRVLRQARTDSRGNVTVSTRPTTNASYGLRWAGQSGTLGVSPGTTSTVTVGVRVTARLTISSPVRSLTARRRSVVRLTGAVSPGSSDRKVLLQLLVGRTWRNIGTAMVDRKNTYGFTLPTGQPGAARYRVYRPADTFNGAGASAVQTLKVV